MAPDVRTIANFEQIRRKEAWNRTAAFQDVDAARAYASAADWLCGSGLQRQLGSCLGEAHAMAQAARPGPVLVAFDRQGARGYVSLVNSAAAMVTTWTFELTTADAIRCLQTLASLAARSKKDCSLALLPQQNRSHQWRATLVHPMQARETDFRRFVHEAGRAPDAADPRGAESEMLSLFCQQSDSTPERMQGKDRPNPDVRVASVGMNHLIDSFYLFRLLVRYEAVADGAISEDDRSALSGELTRLLHGGDPARTGWLSGWLIRKMKDLAQRIEGLNRPGERNVIFFLKGGRALNYFLGTPELGQNDWDTQVVINPQLPARTWYALLSQVHDVLLEALEIYQAELARLFAENAIQFFDYLEEEAAKPLAAPTGEVAERNLNDVLDATAEASHASCKAELIDIGIPRRDSAAGIEEWHRLGAPGGILVAADGVRYPCRSYYLNEYLMMTREAFRPGADAHRAATPESRPSGSGAPHRFACPARRGSK